MMIATRPFAFAALGASALALAACNAGPSTPVAAIPAPAGTAQPSTQLYQRLPEGAGCTTRIETFQRVIKNDLDTGHVGKGVYESIERELEQASALCRGGRDAEAGAAVGASRKKHGYPPG